MHVTLFRFAVFPPEQTRSCLLTYEYADTDAKPTHTDGCKHQKIVAWRQDAKGARQSLHGNECQRKQQLLANILVVHSQNECMSNECVQSQVALLQAQSAPGGMGKFRTTPWRRTRKKANVCLPARVDILIVHQSILSDPSFAGFAAVGRPLLSPALQALVPVRLQLGGRLRIQLPINTCLESVRAPTLLTSAPTLLTDFCCQV